MKRLLIIAAVLLASLLPSASYAQTNPPVEWHDPYLQVIPSNPDYAEHLVYHKYYTNAVFHYDDWDNYMKLTLWTADGTGAVMNAMNSAFVLWGIGGYWPSWQGYGWFTGENGKYSADVDIFNDGCGSTTAYACISWNSFYGVNPHHARVAQRTNFRLTGNWWSLNSSQRISAMSHELGHILGRGEGYVPSNPQCNTVVYPTIMDAFDQNGNPCDGSTPTSGDQQANSYSWTNGFYTYAAYVSGGGGIGQAWEDWTHNEGKVQVEWYYWNSGAGNYLNFYSTQALPNDIGSHRSVSNAYSAIDTYISFGVAPVNYGVPYYSSIKLCVTPIQAGIPGERRCSPPVQYTP